MYTVSKNKNDYFYYLVKLRRCTKIETLIIRLSVLGVQNRFQLSRTFLPLCNFLAPPSVSRVNYTRIRLLSMRGYLRSALYLYNSVVSWFIAQLSHARALLCASTLKVIIFIRCCTSRKMKIIFYSGVTMECLKVIFFFFFSLILKFSF